MLRPNQLLPYGMVRSKVRGCSLSTLWFNLYINDLITHIKAFDVGIDIGDEKVAIMLYADDLILIGQYELELQWLLDELGKWCAKTRLKVNDDKLRSFISEQKVLNVRISVLNAVKQSWKPLPNIPTLDSY